MKTANNYVFDIFLIASLLTGYMLCPGNCPDGHGGGLGWMHQARVTGRPRWFRITPVFDPPVAQTLHDHNTLPTLGQKKKNTTHYP